MEQDMGAEHESERNGGGDTLPETCANYLKQGNSGGNRRKRHPYRFAIKILTCLFLG